MPDDIQHCLNVDINSELKKGFEAFMSIILRKLLFYEFIAFAISTAMKRWMCLLPLPLYGMFGLYRCL